MKILVLGSGGREHALVRRLLRDPHPATVIAAPGNPGMANLVETFPVSVADPAAVVALAQQEQVDLVVVGPEAPLVAGVADALTTARIAVFGPSAAAAQLEGSKSFAKDVMAAAQVPTAAWRTCTDESELDLAFAEINPLGDVPYVVKADGLAAGKGVLVTTDLAAAKEHARACLATQGGQVVIEEYLDGPEVSLFCISDGERVIPLAPAQDFKRAFDNDEGPNTGGMGAYSPLPWAPANLVAEVVDRVALPTIKEMSRRGAPFKGLLYCGLALTRRGIKVVEFNARFGDPETQVVLERLRGDFAGLLLAAAAGDLTQVVPPVWADEAAVSVVLAAEGYPGDYAKGGLITGVQAAEDLGCAVIHAGTKLAGDDLLINGGRVLNVVGLGADLSAAREQAYRGVETISLPGFFRHDIALKAAAGEMELS